MAERTIKVYPEELQSGEYRWHWRSDEGDDEGSASKRFQTRGEAFEDALTERTDEAIVLLKADGSVHGELYHAGSPGPFGQHVDVLAASERGEAT